MEGRPNDFWGKWDAEHERWHPLIHHCADVALCMEAILSLDIPRRRLARTGGLDDLSPSQSQRLAFFAALHDIGKFNRGFQGKIIDTGVSAGHVSEAYYLLADPALRPSVTQALFFNRLQAWSADPALFLAYLLVAISHHGRPVAAPKGVDPSIWRADDRLNPLQGLALLAQAAAAWFPAAFEPSDALPSHPPFQHTYSGLVMLADWIGSDTRFFPYSETQNLNVPSRRAAARVALRELGMDTSATRSQRPVLPTFAEMFPGFTPRPIQHTMESVSPHSVAILEAETGSGKTEAALRYYLRLFYEGLVDGLYFALPTQSAAVQLHSRVREAIGSALGSVAPPVILAVPGYIRVDDQDAQRLPHFTVLWPDQERYRYRGWAAEHPKRYMAAPLVVGTIDQVLLSCLQVSHAHMRGAALLRHLLIVDEVHASDVYMTTLLREVLAIHADAGGYALLMSATLGGETRARLHGDAASPTRDLHQAQTFPYPVVTSSTGNKQTQLPIPTVEQTDKVVHVTLCPLAHDSGGIAALAVEKATQGARVLVLRNLVREAVETQQAIEALAGETHGLFFTCEGTRTLHHSRFATLDRMSLDESLEAQCGKSNQKGTKIVVSTQTIQQCLDVDFDYLITDLCPMDVLLQRIGRLHRHQQRVRPNPFRSAQVVVLTPQSRSLEAYIFQKGRNAGEARGPSGIGTVYGDLRILEATWQVLEHTPTLRLPQMNRELVESAMHSTILANIVKKAGARWQLHHQHLEGLRVAHAGLAHLNVINRQEPFTSLDAQFSNLQEAIRTRLGEDDRLVQFADPFRSPFGKRVATLTIPGWLVPGMAPEVFDKPVHILADGHDTVFELANRTFRYDRFGLQREEAPTDAQSIG